MADLRRRVGPVLAVPEGGDGVGVRASLVVTSNGERASDAAPILARVQALDVVLFGTVAMIMLDEIFVDAGRMRIAIKSKERGGRLVVLRIRKLRISRSVDTDHSCIHKLVKKYI